MTPIKKKKHWYNYVVMKEKTKSYLKKCVFQHNVFSVHAIEKEIQNWHKIIFSSPWNIVIVCISLPIWMLLWLRGETLCFSWVKEVNVHCGLWIWIFEPFNLCPPLFWGWNCKTDLWPLELQTHTHNFGILTSPLIFSTKSLCIIIKNISCYFLLLSLFISKCK